MNGWQPLLLRGGGDDSWTEEIVSFWRGRPIPDDLTTTTTTTTYRTRLVSPFIPPLPCRFIPSIVVSMNHLSSGSSAFIRRQNDREEIRQDDPNDKEEQHQQQQQQQLSALWKLQDSLVGWKDDDWPIHDERSTTTLEDLCHHVPGVMCGSRSSSSTGISSSTPTSQPPNDYYYLSWIDWSTMNLKGTLPTEIGWLTTLERLQLGMNQLMGTLPGSSLSRLSLLQHLELHRNEFTGTLPDFVPSLLALKRLLVHSNQFHGTVPTSLCELKSLHSLDLFENPLLRGTLPECLGTMTTNLQTLQIHGTRFTGTIPWDICQRADQGDAAAAAASSSACDWIACPVHSFSPGNGRKTTDSDCRPCPTANYLASKECPLASEPPSPVPTVKNNQETDLPIGDNSTTTFLPSSVLDQEGPGQGPTFRPTVPGQQPLSPDDLWIVPPSPAGSGSIHDPTSTSDQTSPNWILLSVACLLSSLAMLTVVWARRTRRQRQQQQDYDDNDNDDGPYHPRSPHRHDAHYRRNNKTLVGCLGRRLHQTWRNHPRSALPIHHVFPEGEDSGTTTPRREVMILSPVTRQDSVGLSSFTTTASRTSQHSRTRLLSERRERSFSMPPSLYDRRWESIVPSPLSSSFRCDSSPHVHHWLYMDDLVPAKEPRRRRYQSYRRAPRRRESKPHDDEQGQGKQHHEHEATAVTIMIPADEVDSIESDSGWNDTLSSADESGNSSIPPEPPEDEEGEEDDEWNELRGVLYSSSSCDLEE